MANSYLNRNITSNGNAKTWTWSYWVKRAKLGSWMNTHNLGGTANRDYGAFDSSNRLEFAHYNSGYQYRFLTNRVFRDVSAWYHIVIAMDTTQSTESNRTKIYVNGVQETSFNTATYPSQNQNTRGSQDKIMVGADFDPGNYFDGYQSHVAFVDGQALAPTVFGETDSTSGIWKFKSPSGVTWGTNGFHLKFENSGNLGLDSSGNSNTFTVNGNGRQALDTPSNVLNVLNSINPSASNFTLSNGNTTIYKSGTGQLGGFLGTIMPTTGKWYWEAKITEAANGDRTRVGVANYESVTGTSTIQGNYSGLEVSCKNAQLFVVTNGSTSETYASGTYSDGDIVQLAMDLDNKAIYVGRNGTYVTLTATSGGDPTSGANKTGAIVTDTTHILNGSPMCVYFGHYAGASDVSNVSFNFGNGYFGTTAITSAGSNGNGSLFEYDVPSGYYALNTKNINTYG